MKPNSTWRIRLTQVLLGVAIVIALVWVRGTKAGNEPIHLTTDWSHRHVIFSAPQNLGQHVHLLSNPRYVQQLVRRNSQNVGSGDEWRWRHAPEPNGTELQGDWSMDMGPGATVGADNYPSKFSFDSTSANCADAVAPNQPDFVVYNTSLAGVATAVAAHQSVTFAGFFQTPFGTVIITNGASSLTLTAAVNNTGNNFTVISSGSGAGNTTNATSLAAKIVSLGGTVGVTATSAAGVVTITATTAGSAGNSITLTGTMGGANGVTFGGGTFTGGADLQATIGAYDNLYSSCPITSVPFPNVYWAYNTGTTGAIVTSTVLSGGGDQVAFVQNTATTSTLVLLKWKANDGTFSAPTSPTNSATAAAYNTCVTTTTGPCMFTITFSNSNGGAAAFDTHSSPFYDFAHDTLYVGNNNGFLHKFTPVFNGAPAEVISTVGADRWPAAVSSGNVLTSPVFDDDSTSRVFVASSTGILYRVDSTIGSGVGGVTASGTLGTAGIDDSPVLDPSTENVYVFVRGDNGAGVAKRAGVYQFAAGFAATTTGTETKVDSNSTGPATAFYAGTFDNTYYNSALGTGHMYVCATNGSLTALWQLTVTAGALSAPTAGPTLTTVNVACSPVTEFNNGATDRIFLSVTASAVTAGVINCGTPAGGCAMSFNVTAGTVPTTTSAHALEAGGTSAIIVDNSSSAGGASQVYFTPLADQSCTTSGGTGGCAIQASQSGLN